jgi:hypothetical protein
MAKQITDKEKIEAAIAELREMKLGTYREAIKYHRELKKQRDWIFIATVLGFIIGILLGAAMVWEVNLK